ncbi:hypothetical protein RIR_jg7687.t1 [Rhizophagus irregularis DAOM 181602=DAOM 197198]|nr:hypothetical protein RIR_jg7687.t1 [Rhizophagus irregularis DAOM 181602=DAOM 197198]
MTIRMESSKELNLQRNGDSINNFIIFTGNVDSFKIELRPVTHLPGYNPGIVSGLWNSKRVKTGNTHFVSVLSLTYVYPGITRIYREKTRFLSSEDTSASKASVAQQMLYEHFIYGRETLNFKQFMGMCDKNWKISILQLHVMLFL